MVSNFDTLKLSVEMAHPNNTVLLDDMGMPSVMVRIPKFKISDVIAGGSSATFPAFIVNGVEVPEIFISKFPNIVVNERAYSLPMKDPHAYVTFDQAKAFCQNKGKGWHLMTNAEWMAIAHWCKKNGFTPRGNTSYGASHSNPNEKGVPSYIYSGSTVGRTYTGSGPVTWAHDGSPAGIYDLCGNVWEWTAGLRLKDGEFQVIENNNSAAGQDETVNSNLWKAIKTDGTLVSPGTAGTLKLDSVAAGNGNQSSSNVGAMQLSDELTHPQYTGGSTDAYYAYGNMLFENLTAKSGLSVPEIAKVLGIFPTEASSGGHDGDGLWARNYGERLPLRGGDWTDGAQAGVFALSLFDARAHSSLHVGFRAAFVNL